ncbi:MAG: anthranilate phosphoribosyltransferase [Spirochaetota bacterium]
MSTSQEILHKAVGQENLSAAEAKTFFTAVMQGDVEPAVLAAFLTALKIKGESREEILGAVQAMKAACVQAKLSKDFPFLDTCGTGGDGKNSVNISTLSALTLSAIGIKVAKHGNRSVSSLCGSSDLLSELGYSLEIPTDEAEKRLLEKGFTFLFAPHWHPAMKHAVPVRKALAYRTLFNILGPLSNPLSPSHQVLGVFSASLLEDMSYVLEHVGVKHSIVCHSQDGYDEFSIFAPTDYIIRKGSAQSRECFHPEVLHLPSLAEADLACNTRTEAVEKAKQVLQGEKVAASYAVALNAGVALYLFEKAESIVEGYKMALVEIFSGTLQERVQLSIN